MRLQLDVPADWPAELVFEQTSGLLPDDHARWIETTLPGDEGARVRVVTDEITTTACGWPVRVIEAMLAHANGTTGHLIAAFYAMFEHGSTAILRCATSDQLARHRAEARRIIATAIPEWTDDAIALSQLWDLVPRR